MSIILFPCCRLKPLVPVTKKHVQGASFAFYSINKNKQFGEDMVKILPPQ